MQQKEELKQMETLAKQQALYKVNKGVNSPIEFRGLKAQYIYYLAIGLAALLVLFSILYISGTPVYLCLLLILALGTVLFMSVSRLNHRFGQHGLMKRGARRKLPRSIRPGSLKLFHSMNTGSYTG